LLLPVSWSSQALKRKPAPQKPLGQIQQNAWGETLNTKSLPRLSDGILLDPVFSLALSTASAGCGYRRWRRLYGWRTGSSSEELGLVPICDGAFGWDWREKLRRWVEGYGKGGTAESQYKVLPPRTHLLASLSSGSWKNIGF